MHKMGNFLCCSYQEVGDVAQLEICPREEAIEQHRQKFVQFTKLEFLLRDLK
jgi:hypothetical protein